MLTYLKFTVGVVSVHNLEQRNSQPLSVQQPESNYSEQRLWGGTGIPGLRESCQNLRLVVLNKH